MSFLAHLAGRTYRSDAGREAKRETETGEGARPFRWLVRAGFLARAITYGVIGGLALAIALGAGTDGAAPNQQGALALIARTDVGRPVLVVLSAGLLAYALWKLTQGIFGRGPEGGGGTGFTARASNVGGGLVYLAFFAVAIRALMGSSGGSSSEPRQATRGILGWPGGELIVGIAGGALIAISLYQLYDALSGRFAKQQHTEDMDRRGKRVFMSAGRVGLTARALVFALIGYFLVRTAIEYKSSNTVGIDGALARLHHQPLGPWLVGLVGAGLLIFAAYSLLEARYRRL